MILNNIEVKIYETIELEDAYNKIFPEKFIEKNVIYCIHNKVNGKNYVGQTTNFRGRFSESIIGHFKCYNDFITGNPIRGKYLYRAWKKYEFKSFVIYIIDNGKDRDDLNKKETYWIKTLHTCVKDSNCFGYNLTWGADDLGNLNSPEAHEKGNKTKKERYGTSYPFINSHTPEAKEKRKQTLIERYGSESTVTEESLNRMYNTKLEKYGTIAVICSPEDRARASHSLSLTNFFKKFNELNVDKQITTLEQYFNKAYSEYSESKMAKKHLNRVVKLLPDLVKDNRWSSEQEAVFGRDQNKLKNSLEELFKKRKEDNINQMKSKDWGNASSSRMLLISINKNFSSDLTWEKYVDLVFKRDPKHKKRIKENLNKIIDLLPILRTLSGWTSEHERIFGHLTEEDKL